MAVTVIPASLTLTMIGAPGQAQSSATQPGNNSPGTWSVSSSDVTKATATINASGVVTVTMVAVGTCTLTVTGISSQTATIAVTCDNPVTAIPNNVTLGLGKTTYVQLSQPGNSSTWSIVSNTNPGSAGAVVDATGQVTITADPTTYGTAIITVQGANGKQTTITVHVAQGLPYIALVNATDPTIEYGRIYQQGGQLGRVQGDVYIPLGVTHVQIQTGIDNIAIASGGFRAQVAQPHIEFGISGFKPTPGTPATNYRPGPDATKDGGITAPVVYVGGTTRANAKVY